MNTYRFMSTIFVGDFNTETNRYCDFIRESDVHTRDVSRTSRKKRAWTVWYILNSFYAKTITKPYINVSLD